MFYNRERKPYPIVQLGAVDEYGVRHLEETEDSIIGVLGLYSHKPVEDIRYQDVEYYLLTQDEVDDTQGITANGVVYKVAFVNNYGRLKEAFLKRWVLK